MTPHRSHHVLPCALLLVLASSSACSGVAGEVAPGDPEVPGPRSIALRVAGDQPALVKALDESRLLRLIGRQDGVKVHRGARAEGDVLVIASLLPAAAAGAEPTARLARLPVRLEAAAITLGGRRYARREQTLAMRLPGGGPSTWMVVGQDPQRVAALAAEMVGRQIEQLGWWDAEVFDYRLVETPFLRRQGRWRTTSTGGWEIDPQTENDQIAERDRTWAELVAIAGARVVLEVPPARRDDARLRTLARELDQAVVAMAERAGVPHPDPMTVVIEDDYLSEVRYVGAVGAAVLRSGTGGPQRPDVHIVLDPSDGFAYRFGLARALVARAGLVSDHPWLADGAALWLSNDWYGKPYVEWLSLLAAGEVLPGAEELLAEQRQAAATEVLWAPVAAEVIAQQAGTTLREKLARVPSVASIEKVLRSIAARAKVAPAATEPAAWAGSFWAGVSMAMAPGLDTGYHAPGFETKLRYLRGIGVDAVSLMPFASQRGVDTPEIRIMRRSPSSEHDLGMIVGARRAHAHGFRVLWKPHLWVTGSWPGSVAMRTEEDWGAWFRAYRIYILHHAVLASWADADLFCVGVELGKTLDRVAEWRHLITSVRRIFRGRVTYAGNWWGDYDRIPFADQLDAVGVDAYFPLAARADASDQMLREGARAVVAQLAASAARYAKPVLLTEVGFAARPGAWVEPHKEGRDIGDRALSVRDQRRAYEALLGALGRPDWLGGVFLWKTFSFAGTEAGDRADFRFLGRPAEAVIERYFTVAAPASEDAHVSPAR